MSTRLIVALVLATSVACAGRRRAVDRDRDIIREAEIATVQVSTAYDVVARLRGDFLRSRGTVTRTRGTASQRSTPTQEYPPITVFVDDVEAGPVERTLYLIPAIEVFEIRLYRPTDATTKYGSRHNGGVIAVTTKRH